VHLVGFTTATLCYVCNRRISIEQSPAKVTELIKTFPAFYIFRTFSTVFTKA